MDKPHWYDGWIYDRWISRNQNPMFLQIGRLIRPRAKVLDIGCATGRLAFFLADASDAVVGIDLSVRNIERARYNLSRTPHPRISFAHQSVGDILDQGRERFDYAVMTYVLHEIPEPERISLLRQAFQVAETVILGDYLVPIPPGWRSAANEVVERVAGVEHYANFRSFVARGGLHGLIRQMPFQVTCETTDTSPTSHILVLRPATRPPAVFP